MIILGVIEGFYGRPWDADTRLRMLSWLSELGIDAYLYAPKADPWLRRRWREPWPLSEVRLIEQLAAGGRAAGIGVGVGLSPFALYRAYDGPARRDLQDSVHRLCDGGIASLALLFDDMPGDTDALADRQAEIVNDVSAWADELTLRMCPTYYSDDPVLDKVFGPRPPNYLEDLTRQLPSGCTPFWTGPEVCSTTVSSEHLEQSVRRFGRPAALWDNYPVNDSRSRSPHLYLQPLEGRAASGPELLESHWCNAMNQPALSLPALASLADLYGRDSRSREQVLESAGVTHELMSACLPLAESTLAELDSRQQRELQRIAAGSSVAARELSDWISGGYVFDPACLTD